MIRPSRILNLTLDEELANFLAFLAKEEERSKSAVLRRMIREKMEQNPRYTV